MLIADVWEILTIRWGKESETGAVYANHKHSNPTSMLIFLEFPPPQCIVGKQTWKYNSK